MLTHFADMSRQTIPCIFYILCQTYLIAHSNCLNTCFIRYVVLEDYENGIKCYQAALQVDPRHYNSWYGLGMVYLRQEKYEFAEHHFRKAFLINEQSSVLMCYLGMALHSLRVQPFHILSYAAPAMLA